MPVIASLNGVTPEGWIGSSVSVSENGTTRSITVNPPPGWLFFRLHKAN